jgi:D-alanyl-D-alanine carboxypeptidase/D-alanyl-D-alanine-endopeptidase (penicillin-binding protein 4)
VLVAVAIAVATPRAFAQLPGPLDQDVRRALLEIDLGTARVGVMIVDPRTGKALAEYNEDERFIPASNMKLYTSAVALAVLGEDFTFDTTLSIVPAENEGELPDLVVTGSGDPGFADPELLEEMGMTVEDLVGVWADVAINAAAEASGGETIAGFDELIVDARIFDDQTVHESWPTDQLNRWYCAEVWGLNFHANLVHLHAKPTEAGAPPLVELEPDAPGLRVRNRARTVTRGPHNAWAAREIGTNTLTLFDNVRGSASPIEVAITDGPLVFGNYLEKLIERRGVSVARVRLAGPTDEFPSARPLHVIRTPIATALRRCNQDSYNLYAEALLKRVAHEVTGVPGSWAQGSAVMQMMIQPRLERADVSDVTVADGSGMSRDNATTPEALAEWLTAIANEPALWPAFRDSLATPDAGTAGVRRLGRAGFTNDLHAKSGYLTGVRSMSGYLVDPETGTSVVFVTLVNDPSNRASARNVHNLFQRVATVADDWLTTEAAAVAIQQRRERDAAESHLGG